MNKHSRITPPIPERLLRPATPELEAQALAEALASVDAGKGIPAERVIAWLESWGTDNELPPPHCE